MSGRGQSGQPQQQQQRRQQQVVDQRRAISPSMRVLVIQLTRARTNFALVLTGRSPRRKSHQQVSVKAGLSMPMYV